LEDYYEAAVEEMGTCTWEAASIRQK